MRGLGEGGQTRSAALVLPCIQWRQNTEKWATRLEHKIAIAASRGGGFKRLKRFKRFNYFERFEEDYEVLKGFKDSIHEKKRMSAAGRLE